MLMTLDAAKFLSNLSFGPGSEFSIQHSRDNVTNVLTQAKLDIDNCIMSLFVVASSFRH